MKPAADTQFRAVSSLLSSPADLARCDQAIVEHHYLRNVSLVGEHQILGPTQDRIVIIDGKKVRHGGVQIVNAVNATGRFLGRVMTDPKSNEIPAGRQLLRQQDLVGKIVLADALHTQVETARQILYEQGGDYLLSSFTLPELQAQGMLALKRGYWVVESRLHHCLDISLQEDQSRVRTPRAARVLGTIRRVVLSLANAAVDKARTKNPKTKSNTKTFQQRFRSARGGRERLQALVFAKSPNVSDL